MCVRVFLFPRDFLFLFYIYIDATLFPCARLFDLFVLRGGSPRFMPENAVFHAGDTLKEETGPGRVVNSPSAPPGQISALVFFGWNERRTVQRDCA